MQVEINIGIMHFFLFGKLQPLLRYGDLATRCFQSVVYRSDRVCQRVKKIFGALNTT